MTRVRNPRMIAITFALGAALLTSAYGQDSRSGRRGRGFMQGSFLGLVSLEPVQKDLQLSEDQIGKAGEIGEKLRADMREQFAALRDIDDRQKQRAKWTELGEEYDEKARQQLAELLGQEQMMRLYQIRLQVRGAVFGLNNRWIAGRLELTDQQKKKAAEIEKATRDKIFDAYGSLRNLSQEERREKYAQLRDEIAKIQSAADEQALELLTAEQKKAFEEGEGEDTRSIRTSSDPVNARNVLQYHLPSSEWTGRAQHHDRLR